MIVSFNPSVSNCKKQKPAFGDARSANRIKTTLQTALETNAPDLKITPAKALERVHEALRAENDKTGKSILRRFRDQLERLS